MSKIVDDFEKNLNDLDSELDNIQKCAQEILQKVENSFSYPYSISSVTNELNVLLLATQHFEKRAKSFGVTSLTTNSTTAASTDIKAINEPGRLNTMVEEKKLAVDALNQESKRIADNAKAAYQLQ
ncbi:hypothetical protein RhiirA5_465534 [Rhizophagus irregularis]|uniref:Uncharacterized protein n=3 Tax=Rhizophagus irregularis TaxID=588596 RepID=A0A2I1E8A9_9GLOM|nr:hypothetical protein GLOIN_2v1642285 [Rhizophagus irregularis DAOM 181602=DAOM 197198]EXX71084.1 hypothetical protein RirG_081830 [Rhizophagus irregularis DAOM 197198w]PKC11958.1 hypothetical protein RhiirA5_465534 [Rhizophagus irregularis]PKC71596.1 hypothetical protein RhiirA1_531872 [Rhizophagus irregularis]PKK73842.1 hypothetical protein RhiirC2_822507 [Rhizophagus irregularis]PKY18385.1 hypothetical protein RhiirB3_431196 [Rhizophagus irregularis]|eukprot:XP_025174766.1 hypothetical protein GLOIN_2v1642285 [Rhizophagus irregularis DAOM 181602=DAOM 197198]